ncbi:MAG: M16 family metallopeptidase [Gemmatimonadota bacterium]
MKTKALWLALAALAASGFGGPRTHPKDTEAFTVNGLKVILKHNPANEIIAAQLYIRGGSMNLTEATQGIEPLIALSALRGSESFPKEKLNALLDATAASITSFSNEDYTAVSLRTVKPFFDESWTAFADVVMHPAFEPSEVELVRENMLVGIRSRNDNADAYLNEIVRDLFYADHPYHLNPAGVEASVSAITIDQMRAHLANVLETSNLLLVVVGDVSREDLESKVAATLGRLPRGSHVAAYPPVVHHAGADFRVVQRELPTNYITGVVEAPSRRDPDFYAMTVAMNILHARVWEEVRTKRGLSYAPAARFWNSLSNRAGIYVTAVDPAATIPVMLDQVRKLQAEPVSAKDLDDRKAMYLTRYFLQNETNASQAGFLASFELAGLGWAAGADYVRKISEVTVEDVQRVANAYLHDFQFGVLGDPSKIDEETFTQM